MFLLFYMQRFKKEQPQYTAGLEDPSHRPTCPSEAAPRGERRCLSILTCGDASEKACDMDAAAHVYSRKNR